MNWKTHNMNWKIAFLLAMTLILLTSGCIGPHPEDTDRSTYDGEDRIIVAVSIPPQAEFVEQIAGNRVRTIVMIPPGASPATHEPTPGQLKDVAYASMYAIVGSGLPFEEVWLTKIRAVNQDMLIVDSSEGITLRMMGEGTDPHIWTSPQNAKVMVENIYQGLVRIDPDNQGTYYTNKEEYLDKLDKADTDIRNALSGKEGSSFMVFHPSWGYFADEYELNMIPIEIEGKEPSAHQLSQIIDTAKQNNITIIFVQTQFSSQSAEAIAQEIDGTVVPIDPLAENYVENIGIVNGAFVQGLAE